MTLLVTVTILEANPRVILIYCDMCHFICSSTIQKSGYVKTSLPNIGLLKKRVLRDHKCIDIPVSFLK